MHKDDNYFVLFKPKTSKVWYYYCYRWGRKIWRTTGKKTKAEAQAEVLRRISLENILNDSRQSHLFSEFAKDYWNYDTCPTIQAKLKRKGKFSVKLAKIRQQQLEDYILPEFGSRFLEEITEVMVRDWILNLPEKKTLSNKTCNDIFTGLKAILDEAVFQKIITVNVARNVMQLYREKSTRKGTFTPEEIKEILNPERWDNKMARAGCLVAAYTGMRLGEVRALTVEQVHDNYIDINADYTDEEGRKCTKSGWGRIAPVPPEVAKYLKQVAPSDSGYIFTRSGLKPVSEGFFKPYLLNIMDALNIDYETRNLSFHSFRYFMNTRLVAGNIEGEKIRSVIGHERSNMTMHYLRLSEKDMDDIRKIQKDSIGV